MDSLKKKCVYKKTEMVSLCSHLSFPKKCNILYSPIKHFYTNAFVQNTVFYPNIKKNGI